MPRRGSSNRGGRGRGRGGQRGTFGGGGRGRNRNLIPSSSGFLYELKSNVDSFDEDFRVYGQFTSDEEDSEPESSVKRSKCKTKKDPYKAKLIQQHRLPLESSYTDSLSVSSEGLVNNKFSKVKSKYLKAVTFTKPTGDLKTTKENEDLPDSVSKLSLNDSKKLCSGQKKLKDNVVDIDLKNKMASSDKSISIKFERYATSEKSQNKNQVNETIESNILENKIESSDSGENVEFKISEANPHFEDSCKNESKKESANNTDYSLGSPTASDDDENEKAYFVLNNSVSKNKFLDQMSDEEVNIIQNLDEAERYRSKNQNFYEKNKRHQNKDYNTLIDPSIFGQSFGSVLSEVPSELKPGMRKWHEKQQRKEDRKLKKEEAKMYKKEKGKNKANNKQFSTQIIKIDERLRDFIMDESISSFQFAPMEAYVRKQLHILAATYKLTSRSEGTGSHRSTIVTKTGQTYIPEDRRYIDSFLSEIQIAIDEQSKINEKNFAIQQSKKRLDVNNRNKPGMKPKQKQNKKQLEIKSQTGLAHGTVVAFDAPPIQENNVGHRMLAAMGWKQGDSLGSNNNGIITPIEAIVRKKNSGLGT